MPSTYDFAAQAADGRKVALSSYQRKLLLVNVASTCGLSPQEKSL